MKQRRRGLTIIGVMAVLGLLFSAWTARAAPQLNPPPAIWCPGPGGVMALCSPVPTPQARRAPDGYGYAGWTAPRARLQPGGARFWITGRRP